MRRRTREAPRPNQPGRPAQNLDFVFGLANCQFRLSISDFWTRTGTPRSHSNPSSPRPPSDESERSVPPAERRSCSQLSRRPSLAGPGQCLRPGCCCCWPHCDRRAAAGAVPPRTAQLQAPARTPRTRCQRQPARAAPRRHGRLQTHRTSSTHVLPQPLLLTSVPPDRSPTK